MAQRPRIKEFKTKDGDEIPFDKGEGGLGLSGSRWTTKELNWLAVHFQDECELEDVFSPGTELSGPVAEYIRSELLANELLEWDQLCARDFKEHHLYSRLFYLETMEEKQRYYSPSAGTSTQASSAQKDQQSQRSPSQTSEASSAYDRQLSLTPTRRPVPLKMHKKPENFATASSPLGPKPSELPEVLGITRALKRAPSKNISMKNLYGVKGPTGPWSEGINRPINPNSQVSAKYATAPAGSPSKSSHKGVTFLAASYPPWETSSDTACTDHSSQPSESESDSKSDGYDEEEEKEEDDEDDVYDLVNDKYEIDVVSVA